MTTRDHLTLLRDVLAESARREQVNAKAAACDRDWYRGFAAGINSALKAVEARLAALPEPTLPGLIQDWPIPADERADYELEAEGA